MGGTKQIEHSLMFGVPPSALYNAFLDKGDMIKLTMSPAEVDPKVGGVYELFGGSVRGEIKELKKNEKIVMSWKFGDWKEDSTVTIDFEDCGDDITDVKVKHSGIPDDDNRCLDGWKEKLLGRIAKQWMFPLED